MTSLPNQSTGSGWVEEDFEVRRDMALESAARGALDAEQLDGLACAYCGRLSGAMKPIAYVDRQLFMHALPCSP
jgi:hypothetical protein